MKSSSETMQPSGRRPIGQRKIAYEKPQPVGMVRDVFIGSPRCDRRVRRGAAAARPPLPEAGERPGGPPHIGYVTEDLYRTFNGDAAGNIAKWFEASATAA